MFCCLELNWNSWKTTNVTKRKRICLNISRTCGLWFLLFFPCRLFEDWDRSNLRTKRKVSFTFVEFTLKPSARFLFHQHFSLCFTAPSQRKQNRSEFVVLSHSHFLCVLSLSHSHFLCVRAVKYPSDLDLTPGEYLSPSVTSCSPSFTLDF